MAKYFTLDEFKCKHCGENQIKYHFVLELDALREQCGFPLVVSSGYRCPEHNQAVSTTGPNGPHTTGLAADLAVERGQAYIVLREALKLGFTGIGVNQTGSGRFVHVDILNRKPPTIWSY
jgi:uncharacterized protein YcbK (DUF882 family)